MEIYLLLLFLVLLVMVVVWLISGYRPKKSNPKVSMRAKYMQKDHELHVRIESIGKQPVEIIAPELRLYNRVSSRVFTIKSSGQEMFPLSLYPDTYYEFKVGLHKFYDRDITLKDYRKMTLIVKAKTNRLLKSKSFWI